MTSERTFTKNGRTRTAVTPAAAVKLRHDGWNEVAGPAAAPIGPATDEAPGDPEAPDGLGAAAAGNDDTSTDSDTED